MKLLPFIIVVIAFISFNAVSERFWTSELTNWKYFLNNGVGYVQSSEFPTECAYDRAQINFSSTSEYMKNIAAYILAASKTGESIRVVLDHDTNAPDDTITCVILSVATVAN